MACNGREKGGGESRNLPDIVSGGARPYKVFGLEGGWFSRVIRDSVLHLSVWSSSLDTISSYYTLG